MAPEPTPPERPAAWRLAGSASAYLRDAADQPVPWQPWSEAAFAEAARRRVPVLLDIGAVWCHWCHVMDQGTYSDPEVARLIQQHFVAVKVDRDERPEVDRRYQRQVSTLTGEGGWPLTAFLTPQGEVFLGGTYFPAEDGIGRPGLRRVLREVARLWREEPERIQENATAVRAAIDRTSVADPVPPASDELLAGVRAELAERFDPVHGGFGMAPKFPHPTAVAFLLLDGWRQADGSAIERARATLAAMASGGMYDHLGGGFHRYSVDEGWRIPHFEKMGEDNAALLDVYAEAVRRFADPRFEEVVVETVGWVRGTLLDPSGGFGASQDADNAPGDDGSYFTWSRAELRAALEPEELRLVQRFYGVGGEGRMPHDLNRNVLYRPLPLADAMEGTGVAPGEAEERLARARSKLLAVRAERPAPTVDRALYARINGSFLRAFAHVARLRADPTVLADARRAADRFLREGYRPGGGMAHRIGLEGPAGFGLLEDQAEFAYGLLELAAACAEPRYVETARELLGTVLREFRAENGLLRDLAPTLYDGPPVAPLSTPSFPLEDHPHLAANAAAALGLIRLAALTGDEHWREEARPLLGALSGRLQRAGLFAAGTAYAVRLLDTSAPRVIVEGAGPVAQALERTAVRTWSPTWEVFVGRPPPPFELPGSAEAPAGESARALVCLGRSCRAPITEPSALAAALGERPS